MYNSPIRIITSDLGMKVTEDLNEQIYQSVLNVGIDVDKGELLRALQYDRGQYEKGYADGKADAAPEWLPVSKEIRVVLQRMRLKPWTYTLEEIAGKICGSYEECTEGECPGFAYCNSDMRGALVWLRKVVNDDN